MKTKTHKTGPKTAIVVKKETTWFYESRGGIEIIHWCDENAIGKAHVEHINIPWRILLDAAKRCRPDWHQSTGTKAATANRARANKLTESERMELHRRGLVRMAEK